VRLPLGAAGDGENGVDERAASEEERQRGGARGTGRGFVHSGHHCDLRRALRRLFTFFSCFCFGLESSAPSLAPLRVAAI
jgi:hypothetical protein